VSRIYIILLKKIQGYGSNFVTQMILLPNNIKLTKISQYKKHHVLQSQKKWKMFSNVKC